MSADAVGLERLNAMSAGEAEAAFLRCCGAARWARQMISRRPFADRESLRAVSDAVWAALSPDDWREAFAHHPRIGDLDSLRSRFADTRVWAAGEQSGTGAASEELLRALAEGNTAYEARFGYLFIVCATGKTAEEMLARLQTRLHNDPETELGIAAGEQNRITRLRLDKLVE